MNKKLLTIFLVLAMFFGLSVYSVVGTHSWGSITYNVTHRVAYTGIGADGNYISDNYVKSGSSAIVNVTLKNATITGSAYINNVSIRVPSTSSVTINVAPDVNTPVFNATAWRNNTFPMGPWNTTSGNVTDMTTNRYIDFKNYTTKGNISRIYDWFTFSINMTMTSKTEGTAYVWTTMSKDNDTGTDTSALTFTTYVDGLAPRIVLNNVTDAYGNVVTNFGGTMGLRNSTWTFTATVTEANWNLTGIKMFYSNVSNATATFNIYSLTSNASIRSTIITMNNITSMASGSALFNGSIVGDLGHMNVSDGVTQQFTFFTVDVFNNSEYKNLSGVAYKIKVDNAVPIATLTAPSDTTIDVQNPIKYTCTGSDAVSGYSCALEVTKPDGTVLTKATTCGTEYTLINTDTNAAGTYSVKCKVTDNVGFITRSSEGTFTASYSSTGGSSSGGGGSSSSDDEEVVDEGTGETTGTETTEGATSGETGTEAGTAGTGTEGATEGEISGEGTAVSNGSNVWLWVILGVVLVGLVVAFVVIKKRK